MKLVVLESPTKTKALQKFLGADYQVVSCEGHIFKMTKVGLYKLGINWENFEPLYEIDPTKTALLAKLTKLAKQGEVIYIATDPDREGEAIAAHLSQTLQQAHKTQRVLFNEITRSAVLLAFQTPTQINQNLVASQSTRRVLDRMIGFRLSRLLQTKLFAKSAGRVQSVALHLLALRQAMIDAFKTQKYWEISFKLFEQRFLLKKWQNRKLTISTLAKARQIQTALTGSVKLVKDQRRQKTLATPAFLTTSKLLQLAASKLNFSVKKTTFLAQKLYEGIKVDQVVVGFITYPRTDSTRINPQFRQTSNQWLTKLYGKANLAMQPTIKVNPTKVKIQDAHEAIRITDWTMTPTIAAAHLAPDLLKLYRLIYQSTIAAQLKPSQVLVQTVTLAINDYHFETQSEFLQFAGFQIAFNPKLVTQQPTIDWTIATNQPIKLISTAKTTKPPKYLGEGELIRAMEENGVGRPSTYSSMISKLLDSLYLEKTDKKLVVTPKGMQVDQFLQTHFSDIINSTYTADLEQKLDDISLKPAERLPLLQQFWAQFNLKVQEKQKTTMKPTPKPLEQNCPDCDHKLLEREGRFGMFISCSNYPECKYRQSAKPATVELVTETCPQCQSPLAKRNGRFGPFLGCSKFPTCRFIKPTAKAKAASQPQLLTVKCPECQNYLATKTGRFGSFVSCSNYPACKYRPPKVKKYQPTFKRS